MLHRSPFESSYTETTSRTGGATLVIPSLGAAGLPDNRSDSVGR